MQRTGASRSVSRGSFGNLDESLLGDETLVAYAAAAGTTAADGTGRNSPYTSALLAYLEQPLEIGLLFREVRARVLEAERTASSVRTSMRRCWESTTCVRRRVRTRGRWSWPWVWTARGVAGCSRGWRRRATPRALRTGCSVRRRERPLRSWQTSRGATATGYLDAADATALGVPVAGPAAVPSVAPTATVAAVAAPNSAASAPTAELTRAETVFWESMRESTSAADFEAYLARWPSGIYAPLATNRLAALREAATAPPAADPARPREAGDVFRDCPTCPEVVVIPGGEFLMGSDRRDDESYDNERPRHRVTVGGFALGVHEGDAG